MSNTFARERAPENPFFHPNNLRMGRGRILWGAATTLRDGTHLQEGWVLPGGRRTQDASVAIAAANYIDGAMFLEGRK